MKNTILKYGVASGLLISALLVGSFQLQKHVDTSHGFLAYTLGYTIMVVSFLVAFFGVRAYRDQECGGQIGFGKALSVALLISLFTCVFYVVTWEIMYFKFMPDFMTKMGAQELDKMRAAGASAVSLQKKAEALAAFKKQYDNPVFNSVVTFLEPLPVAILMSVIAALVLRRKSPTAKAAS